MYIQPKRLYRNRKTGKTSPLLYEVVDDKVTARRSFTCGNRRGTWTDDPFLEIETVPPVTASEIAELEVVGGGDPETLFNAIYTSIEQSWQRDKCHVVFLSSGWDSRIISAAIKRLSEKYAPSWLSGGLLFLANRWEAKEAYEIYRVLSSSLFDADFFAFEWQDENMHFASPLSHKKFWRVTNAPIPLPGNLWDYLVDHAQLVGNLPSDNYLQGFSGLWANETWRAFNEGGAEQWARRFKDQYYYNVMAALPCKIPQMEYPLTDLEVLKLMPGGDGDKLRREVAEFALPEAIDIPHLSLDDRGHPIADELREYCEQEYHKSWFSNYKDWRCPETSEFSADWARYGLASLCEHLIGEGVDVQVTD